MITAIETKLINLLADEYSATLEIGSTASGTGDTSLGSPAGKRLQIARGNQRSPDNMPRGAGPRSGTAVATPGEVGVTREMQLVVRDNKGSTDIDDFCEDVQAFLTEIGNLKRRSRGSANLVLSIGARRVWPQGIRNVESKDSGELVRAIDFSIEYLAVAGNWQAFSPSIEVRNTDTNQLQLYRGPFNEIWLVIQDSAPEKLYPDD